MTRAIIGYPLAIWLILWWMVRGYRDGLQTSD